MSYLPFGPLSGTVRRRKYARQIDGTEPLWCRFLDTHRRFDVLEEDFYCNLIFLI